MENNEYWVYDIVYFKFFIYVLLCFFYFFERFCFLKISLKKSDWG